MKSYLRGLFAIIALTIFATQAVSQDNYRIQSGDTLTIEVLEDSSLNRSVQVLPDGRISFPFAGTVLVEGRTVGQVEATLTDAISRNFADPPNVFVSVRPSPPEPQLPPVEEAPPTIDIYFLGEVNAPGLKQVEPGTTFLQAMSQSGGLTNFAAAKRIQLRRGDQVYSINFRAVMDGRAQLRDFRLSDGDVILVPERRLFE